MRILLWLYACLTLASQIPAQTWKSQDLQLSNYKLGPFVSHDSLGLGLTDQGQIYWSQDGSHFQIQKISNQELRAITWAQGAFWVAGDQGTLLKSTDGKIWQSISLPTQANLYTIDADSNHLVLAGDSLLILHSSNGIQWYRVHQGGTDTLQTLTHNSQTWIAAGSGGQILSSSDLQNWQSQTVDPNHHYLSSMWDGQRFYLGGFYLWAYNCYGLIQSGQVGNWNNEFDGTTKQVILQMAPSSQGPLALGYNGTLLSRSAQGSWDNQTLGTSQQLKAWNHYLGQNWIFGNAGTALLEIENTPTLLNTPWLNWNTQGFHLESQHPYESFSLYNLQGQLLYSTQLSRSQAQYIPWNLSSGSYVLNLNSKTQAPLNLLVQTKVQP